mmetsp:Transcript_19570/g.48804  ORF Transcript_19570/g.48804 Transcript_19570/m.48804 type:complete len:92 (-) Transcript_19570:6-281(-)
MPQCASCAEILPRNRFSASQLKAPAPRRRCLACVGAHEKVKVDENSTVHAHALSPPQKPEESPQFFTEKTKWLALEDPHCQASLGSPKARC